MTYRQGNILKIYFPYCVKDLDPKLGLRAKRWVVLNRDYKPCGYLGTERVDYSLYAVGFPHISSRSIMSVSVPTDATLEEGERTFWFYPNLHPASLLRSPKMLSGYFDRITKFSRWEIRYPYLETALPYGYQPPDHRP